MLQAARTTFLSARRACVLALSAALAALGTSAARAAPADLSRAALGQAILNSGRNSINALVAAVLGASRGEAAAAQSAPPQPPAPVTYDPDPRLSEWTRRSMIDTLSQGDPGLREALEKAFADDRVLAQFDRFMADRGYSSHDVADDTAELLLTSWQIATGRTPTESQALGVHRQTHAAFASIPQLRELTNADRQLLGERIAYQVIISSAARQQYERSADPARGRQLRESAGAILEEQGIDLTQLQLTDRGFSR